jgi:hypothetical protein
MGAIQPKPEWVDSIDDGKFECDKCSYKSNSDDNLGQHTTTYHNENTQMILYMNCDGSIEGRNELNNSISAKWIDCTGGQAAYEDGDLQEFGDELVMASRNTGHKIYCVFRMHDPGLGLDFPGWWIQGGLNAGVFQQYEVPDDVHSSINDKHSDNKSESATESATESETESETITSIDYLTDVNVDIMSNYYKFDGYEIETNLQTIKVMISNMTNCCEAFGVNLILPDDLTEKDLIGKEIYSVQWDNLVHKSDNYVRRASVLIETELGNVYIVAENEHNGYYAHNVYVEWKDYSDEQEI